MNCNEKIGISVIIPMYNVGSCIQQTLDNLKKQTFQQFEIILVNDGSIDNTHEVCLKLASENARITYLKKENGGAGSARNRGIEEAQGKYLYFLDGDDEIAETLLERIYSTAEEQQADLVVFALERRIINSLDGSIQSKRRTKQLDANFLTRQAFEKAFGDLYYDGVLFGGPVNKLFRTDIVKENGVLFPNLRRGQDEIFNLLYYPHVNNVAIISDVLYFYNAYDEIAKQRKYRLDYFEKTMITYFKTLQFFLDGFYIEDENLVKKKAYSFVYALENGFLLAWNPLERLNARKKKTHIQKILSDEFVQEQIKAVSNPPRDYEKFWACVQNGQVNRIYRMLAWQKWKERVRSRFISLKNDKLKYAKTSNE